MSFDTLSPPARVEVQELYVLRDTKARDFTASGQSERRRPRKVRSPWPQRIGVWPVNDAQRRLERRSAREMEPKDAIRNGR